MDRWLDVPRAARVAGVSRTEIQQHIAQGDLPATEGRVQVSDLLKLYPDVEVSGFSMVDIVSQIRDDAVAKADRQRDSDMDIVELRETLKKYREEAVFYKDRADHYKQILSDLKGMLGDARSRLEPGQRSYLDAVIQWMTQKMKANP